MKDFVAIDFETGNPKRVSACSIGYARVSDCKIVDSKGFLIKPIGGHAPFQSKIHGIKNEHTFDKPEFGELFSEIEDIFDYPLVGHSLFDKQVLSALSDHFDLELEFDYIDSCNVAKERYPELKCFKLKALAKFFNLPPFKHHDAIEDAVACANIFLKVQEDVIEELSPKIENEIFEFKGLASGILADDEVNYKEAYALLYWLEDHLDIAQKNKELYLNTKAALDDNHLDRFEAADIKMLLKQFLKETEYY